MVNEELIIIEKIKTLLKPSLSFIGDYRDLHDFKVVMGDRYPAVLIEDADESLFDEQPSLTVDTMFPITLWLYHNVKKEVSKTMLDLTNTIKDALLDDTFLNALNTALTGTISLVEWYNTEKGSYLENFDFRAAGFSDDRICWKIYFYFNFQTAR